MMRTDKATREDEIEEGAQSVAAADWAAKLAGGPLAADDARAFTAWVMADPENERRLRAAKAFNQDLGVLRQLPDYHALLAAGASPRDRFGPPITQWFRSRRRLIAGVWGLMAVGLASVAVFALFLHETPTDLMAAPADATAFATDIAELRQEILPDGSVAVIGARSSIKVAFDETSRRVYLAEGEAFFDVETDPERPFTVVAGDHIVRVLGTEFDVSLSARAVDIAVLEGRVEVIHPEDGATVIGPEAVKHVLTAGQTVRARSAGVEPVRTVAMTDVAAWRSGKLAWSEAPLHEIIADLNRYDAGGVRLVPASLGDAAFTLSVPAADPQEAVALIAASLDLEVVQDPSGVTVLRK